MLEINKLRKNYGTIEALKGISFSIAPGEIFGLLGPNGAGKSTAINIIAGILSPTSGTVSIAGFNMLTDPTPAKRALGVVLQDAVLVEEISALQNCLFFGSLYGIPKQKLWKRSLDLLSWIGLSDRAREPVNKFSGGMKRRLSMVLGILHEPSMLLLDEPTVGMDPQTRLKILESIEDIAGKGTSVLFSTHYLDEAERLCDRIGIIDDGKILKEGTLESLRADIEDIQIITLRGSFEKEAVEKALSKMDDGKVLLAKEEEMVISIPSSPSNVNAILESTAALGGVNEVTIKPPSLESLFISLTGKKIRE